ncbi:hypothetical protein [Nostoc sp.]|uniref:hypothetical protein n=1 Tax=Nostoc sp. TaxID=1180 RepID=UPI002FFA2867
MNTTLSLITTAIGTGAMPAFDSDIISKAELLQKAILTLQLSIQQIFLFHLPFPLTEQY